MRKKSAKKILIMALSVLLVLALAVDIFGANYLVSFAIGRRTSGGAAVVPPSSTTSETKSTVSENKKAISEATKAWKETVTPENVSLVSADGLKLVGDIYTAAEQTNKWVILVHGYTSRRAHMMDYARLYAQRGYNLLLPDMRGHGESEGEYIGMGWPDRLDVLLWINMIVDRCPDAQIVLHGVSMGAATVMMCSGENLPANVKAIVEDCGYTSVWDIFSDELHILFGLPEFPLLQTASVIGKLRAGYNFTEASALEQVKKSVTPMLFLHGGEDNFVHTEMIYPLYDACTAPKDILVIENAGHGQAFYYAPETYEEATFRFLSQFIEE